MKRIVLWTILVLILVLACSAATAEDESFFIAPWSLKKTCNKTNLTTVKFSAEEKLRAAYAHAALWDLKNNEATKSIADNISFKDTSIGLKDGNRIRIVFITNSQKETLIVIYDSGDNYMQVIHQTAGEGRYFPQDLQYDNLKNNGYKAYKFSEKTAGLGTDLYATPNTDIGIWEADHYVDEFGDKLKAMYITTPINGTFDTSSYKGNDLTGWWLIDEDSFCLVLQEYGNKRVSGPEGLYKWDYYEGKLKDSSGKTYDLGASCGYGATDRLRFDEKSTETLKKAFRKGGSVSIYLNLKNHYSQRTYRFSMSNVTGFGTLWNLMFE